MTNSIKTILIFIFTTIFMVGLFYGIPVITAQPELNMAVILLAGGLVLAGILSGIACASAKGVTGKTVEVKEGEKKAEAAPAAGKRLFDEKAVQMLSILQKKGRLIDFLQEDISGYDDAQIGAAVRTIHKDCREAITEHMNIEPVMKEDEGSDIMIEEGFDPSVIRLTGNVVGSPPFKGVLRHNGWRVSTTDIPPLPKNQELSIIEPAEVEII